MIREHQALSSKARAKALMVALGAADKEYRSILTKASSRAVEQGEGMSLGRGRVGWSLRPPKASRTKDLGRDRTN